MANTIWTIEEFTCAGCSMNYTATREEHAEAHSGTFKCSICSGVVHTWSGKHHFLRLGSGENQATRVRKALGRSRRVDCFHRTQTSYSRQRPLPELRLLLLCGNG